MTLILGFNLSDKLILAADTRMSFNDGEYHDTILKIAALGKAKSVVAADTEQYILTAVAGDIQLSQFLFKEISSLLEKGELSYDIFEFKDSLDAVLRQKMDSWLTSKGGKNSQSCCFMFAGFSAKQDKVISQQRLKKLIEIHNSSRPSIEKVTEIKAALAKTEIGRLLLEKAPKESIDSMHSEIMLKPNIEDALKNGGVIKGEADSLIFTAEISGKNGISYSETKWGELIARGSDGITQSDISDTQLAHMEVSSFANNSLEGLSESLFPAIEIKSFAEKNWRIGGDVVSFRIKKNEFSPNFYTNKDSSGNVESLCPLDELVDNKIVPNKNLVIYKNGVIIPLKKFFEYKTSEQLSL